MSMMPGIIVMPSVSIMRAPGGILIDASGPAATMSRPPARTSDSAFAETAVARNSATINRRMARNLSYDIGMKRTAILAALLVLAACRKPEAPATTSSATPPPSPPAAAQTDTTATKAPYVPPPDVNMPNAPVPTSGLSLWLRADAGVTAGVDGKVSSWANEGSPVKATAGLPETQPALVQNAIGGKPAIH